MTDIPARIGTYSVECEIGRGGMGVVYRATDSRLGRPVAIKALPVELMADEAFLGRFEREAMTLAALNHPNISSIYGLEEHEGQKYIVLEFIEGDTLADRIARGPLRISEVLDIGFQVAAGLAAAHDAGFVHRDLKPANIKITSEGTAKVLDFGLARSGSDSDAPGACSEMDTAVLSDTMTKPGTVLGTAQYMSPEQSRGEPVDRRTDLWALGVVLYEALVGKRPFAGKSPAECLAAIVGAEPDLDALPRATPDDVAALIRRCLRKDPRVRHRDAGDCRLILEDALEALSATVHSTVPVSDISDRSFRISDELCRELDREGFDALLPGWEMLYSDNNRDSDVLIVWIPSIVGDHMTAQWRELIVASPYRMVTVTPVGMEPGIDNSPVVSIENQFALIRALVRELKSSLNPARTIVSGFSCGSIMALRCAAGDRSGELFNGVLAFDPDLQESDCFVTRLFAGLDATSANGLLNGLQKISTSCTTIQEWLVTHQHMVEWVGKVRNDVTPLIRQGRDLSIDYEGVHTAEDTPFVGFLSNALSSCGVVRCVFHDSLGSRRLLGDIRMMHLDTRCLGEKFTDEVFDFLPGQDHIGLMRNDNILEQLERVVQTVQE